MFPHYLKAGAVHQCRRYTSDFPRNVIPPPIATAFNQSSPALNSKAQPVFARLLMVDLERKYSILQALGIFVLV